MKIILMMVATINGKITNADDPDIYKWTSAEDAQLFFSKIKKHNLIVMGSKTYEEARKRIKLSPDKLRIVLTRNPKKYADQTVKGKLEFSTETPKELINRLEKEGYSQMLLVGGSEINMLFLKANLVDEIYLTIEPVIFGKGKGLFAEEDLNVSLRLIEMKRLNERGTMHVKYKVTK